MKKLSTMAILLSLFIAVQFAGAASDITFSTNPLTQGCWNYDKTGYFYFTPVIDVDKFGGSYADPMVGNLVVLPDFQLNSSNTVVTAMGQLQFVDKKDGTVLMSCTVNPGSFNTFYTIAMVYADVSFDAVVTSINKPAGYSASWLNTLHTGSVFDFNLSLISDMPFSSFIGVSNASNTALTGGLTLTPEPMTLIILGIGSMLIYAGKRS